MKRLFIILTLVGSSFFSSSYAADANAAPVVVRSFYSTFYKATEASWEQIGILYKVNFVLDGEHCAAFYNAEGELIAETKNLSSQQLPAPLQSNLKKDMAGLWVTELFEVTVEGFKTYYVKLENADKTVMLKSAGSKKWSLYQEREK